MKATKNSDDTLEILCRSAIEQNLGDLSELPNELVDCVLQFTIDEILQQCGPQNTSGGQDEQTG